MVTYNELCQKLSAFEDRTDHELGDAFRLYGVRIEFYFDGSGTVYVELNRKDGSTEIQKFIDSVGGNSLTKMITFSGEEDLLAILDNPLRATAWND